MPRRAPVVLGPGSAAFVLDRHHTLCALIAEGIAEVPILVMDDLGQLNEEAFWRILEARGWCHAFDGQGLPRPCREIPSQFSGLLDDPFRSLASALRRSGGYAKTHGYFSEFQWTAYLRRHLSLQQVEADFPGALHSALLLARQPEALALPGGRPPIRARPRDVA